MSDKDKFDALNEVRLLYSVRSHNVIGFKEAFIDPDSGFLCIVMELADAGDLAKILDKVQKNGGKMNEYQIWHIFIQIVSGLRSLHRLRIIHRDLKPSNIFLFKDGQVKIGDLNASKEQNDEGVNYSARATPFYCSPEEFKENNYDEKIDIWAAGCVLF